MNNLDVIILCGGKGQRLRPITENIPKPMVEIREKPILSYIIDYLSNNEISNFHIASGYKHEIVNNYINENYDSLNANVVNSGDVDIINRIKDCGKFIDNDFLVLYGDTISDVNIKKLIKKHSNSNMLATMTVWPMRSQFGLVNFDESGKVLSFVEKPILDKFMNIGYFYFDKKILEIMQDFDNWEIFLNYMVEAGILNAFKHQGLHITVNTIEELSLAEKNIDNIVFGDIK
jgi:glucose-1-phosphate cytidylyltransferase